MGILEWLGGVKKSLYDEALEKCRNLEEMRESQEREISQLMEENSDLKGKAESQGEELSRLRDENSRILRENSELREKIRSLERL